jgi:hypothetical protein
MSPSEDEKNLLIHPLIGFAMEALAGKEAAFISGRFHETVFQALIEGMAQ